MTPKEQAQELIDKYAKITGYEKNSLNFWIVKECAITAVNQIIITLKTLFGYKPEEDKVHPYWKEVKEELEKL